MPQNQREINIAEHQLVAAECSKRRNLLPGKTRGSKRKTNAVYLSRC